MNFNLYEDNIGVEIAEVSGDVPNASELAAGTKMSLLDMSDLLYLDGDYYYMVEAEDNGDGFSTITVDCYAFGEDEDTPVGKLTALCGVSSDLDKIVKLIEGSSD